jgi:hypothetical protein
VLFPIDRALLTDACQDGVMERGPSRHPTDTGGMRTARPVAMSPSFGERDRRHADWESAEAREAHMKDVAAAGSYAPLLELVAEPFRVTVVSALA